MKSLAMHITNQNFSFDKFTLVNLQNIFMEHDVWFLPISTNIPQRLKTGFVVQGHIYYVCIILAIGHHPRCHYLTFTQIYS